MGPPEVALFSAVKSGDMKSVATLLRSGASAAARDADLCTPLHLASQKGRAALVPLLLRAGAAVDARDAVARVHHISPRAVR